jgi:hypothetical protein
MPAQRIRWRFPGGWQRSVAAVLIGTLLYFALVDAKLPPASQQPYGLNWGLGIDFLMCVAVFRLTARFW